MNEKRKFTKFTLSQEIAKDKKVKELNIGQKKVYEILTYVIDTLANKLSNLKNNEKIELRGLGTFSIKKRKGRIGRNPKTGESVNIPDRNIVAFKQGQELKQLLKK